MWLCNYKLISLSMLSSELNVSNSYEKYVNEHHRSLSACLFSGCPGSRDKGSCTKRTYCGFQDSPMHVISLIGSSSLSWSSLTEKEGLEGCSQATLKCEVNMMIIAAEMWSWRTFQFQNGVQEHLMTHLYFNSGEVWKLNEYSIRLYGWIMTSPLK